MPTAVENLQKWFDDLPPQQQREVLDFLYGGKVLIVEGLYCGPTPTLVQRGLFCGPKPTVTPPKGR